MTVADGGNQLGDGNDDRVVVHGIQARRKCVVPGLPVVRGHLRVGPRVILDDRRTRGRQILPPLVAGQDAGLQRCRGQAASGQYSHVVRTVEDAG